MQELQNLIGQRLSSYRVTALLGEGGMGVVYLGEHETLGRQVAIKLLRPELAQRAEVVQRFFNEALAANQIKHPGIVDIYDFVRSEVGAYLVMEFLAGEPLSAVLTRDGALPLPTTVLLTRRIASPLAAAHDVGIVHRDLKPDNIFVLPDPDHPGDVRVKLLDFGIAKLREQGHGQPSLQTATGMVLGTPFYMSPEQCHGARAVDHRSDIYALGVIVYQLLTARLPFTATGLGELILKQQTEPPPPMDCAALGVPQAVEAQVLRALAKDPAARFDSAEDFANALALAAGLVEPGATLPPLHEPAQLASVPTATSLPRTVFSSPGMPLPLAHTELPEPSATATQALLGPHRPTLVTGPLPTAHVSPPRASLHTGPQLRATPAVARAATTAAVTSPPTAGRASRMSLGLVFVVLLVALGGGLGLWLLTRETAGPSGRRSGASVADHGAARAAALPHAAAERQDGLPPRRASSSPAKVSADDAPEQLVPAGPFRWGEAAREATLAAFRIDRHEVTVRQYLRCVQAGGCDARGLDGTELPGQVPFRASPRCSGNRQGAGAQPINCVTWAQARQFCLWAGKRLPTEREWEKAARGPDGRRQPWKDGVANCERAVLKRGEQEGCGRGGSWAVGSRSPAGDSPYGVQDLVGNVAEWVEDAYRAVGAHGPARGADRRVVRGGSFTSEPQGASALTRIGLPPNYRLEDVGFRCAR